MTAPLPERIERAKDGYRLAFLARYLGSCTTAECELCSAFDQANAVLDAAIRDALADARHAALGEAAKAACYGCAEGWPLREHDTTAGDGVPSSKMEHDPEGKQSGWLPCTATGIRALATPDRSPT